jgi:hypothetical protein
LPRKREIEAAIAAYNATDPEMLLPLEAAHLLTVMFPSGNVCQCSLDALAAERFNRRVLPRLLGALAKAGFLSKEQHLGPFPNIYRLHLPPVRR